MPKAARRVSCTSRVQPGRVSCGATDMAARLQSSARFGEAHDCLDCECPGHSRMTFFPAPCIRRARSCTTLAFVALFLAACGKPDTDTAPAAAAARSPAAAATAVLADVCTLVSKETVGTIIAQPIVNVVPGKGSCKYETDDAQASSVEIVVKREGAAGEMDTVRKAAGLLGSIGAGMEGGKGATGDVGKMAQGSGAVEGVGEQAFFDSNNTLHVLDKGSYVSIMPPMMKSRMGPGNPLLPAEERRAMAKALAGKVLGKG